ncbi:MAG: DUF882 domain-containing protein [Rhodospirillales bacterium]
MFSAATLTLAAAASVVSTPVLAAPSIVTKPNPAIKSLAMINLNTGESGNFTYNENGAIDASALDSISFLLRDPHNGQTHDIHTDLLDLLVALRQKLNVTAPYQVVSGFRSQETNEEMAAHSRGVAKNSYHMDGMAVDLRVPGRNLRAVRDTAVRMAKGGVGFYPRSNFVHLDVGPVRRW